MNAPRKRRIRRLAAGMLMAGICVGLAACAGSAGEKIDYGAAILPPLEVPPDLERPQDQTPAVDVTAGQPSVAPGVTNVEVRQDGALRWLYVPQAPEVVWPKLREFFLKLGLKIAVEDPTLGIMETDWAENRANVDNGFLQRTLGKVAPSLFSNDQRDRYRARVERVDGPEGGGTQIFLTHRGMEEVLVGGNSAVNVTQSVWQRRPSDPELEAEMLRRLMLALGAPAANAQALQVKAEPRARLDKAADGTASLHLAERVDSAWLRVGIALDRLGYVVKARDDARKTYTLRYVDPGATEEEKGIWAGGDTARKSEARDVTVQLQATGDTTQLQLLAGTAPLAPAQAMPLLQALESQLQ